MKKPYRFDEFFASGLEESISPFITSNSRNWGENIALKTSLISAAFLIISFASSFFNPFAGLALVSCVYFLSGIPALLDALHDLKNLEINIEVLMTFAAFTAVLMGNCLEGALLLVLFNLSHAMEEHVSLKTKSALIHINELNPKFAYLLDREGKYHEKSVKDIQIGDRILIKNGEIIPLDGIIEKGTTSLNLVHLTGESFPVRKTVGDEVQSGSKNLEEAICIKVTKISADSFLTKITHLILQAQEAKPKIQNFLDKFSSIYATSIIGLTFLFAFCLPYFFSIPFLGPEGSVYRSLAFLIAASPCALIIATPTAYLSALSASTRKGILLKGGITLDTLNQCTTIAFDKTGTLTTGELTCAEIVSFNTKNKISNDEALQFAAGLELHVIHPIAKSILQTCHAKGLRPKEFSSVKNIPGLGIEGTLNQTKVYIGNPSLILSVTPKDENLISIEKFVKNSQKMGFIQTFLLIDEELFIFYFKDTVRHTAQSVIKNLKDLKLQPIMLSGDSNANAESVAKDVGIVEFYAELKPEDKLQKISEFSMKKNLIMVGDGMNDAPSLIRASVGISMGKVGSATAIDASDIVLLNDNLELISWLVVKAKKTKKIVLQNLKVALSVIILATLPALLGIVPLWLAVILHEGGTVLVGLNSLRLFKE